MRVTLFTIILLLLYTLSYNVLSPTITFLIMSCIFFIMAVLFSFKKEFYYKYINFVNPKFYYRFNLKDEKFKNRNKKISTICLFLMSIATLMNSSLCNEISTEFTVKFNLKNIIIMFISMFVIYFISAYIFRKNKTTVQYAIFSILLVIITAIIIIAILIFMNIEIF